MSTHQDNQPETDVEAISLLMPNGQVLKIRISNTGRIYEHGTTRYWDADKLAAGLVAAEKAGAIIFRTAL